MTTFKKKSILSLTILFVFSLITALYAQEDKETDLIKLMKQENVPGAQITYVKGGKATSYYLGEKKYQSADKVAATTLFQAASMTKVVASYAALRLLERGLFDLDTPLSAYWPYERLKDDPYVNEITARTVLNHTTGLPNWARNKPLKTAFQPGTDHRYSGEGFFYLQQVLEHLTGKFFEEIVEEEVFIPFGMEESSFLYDDEKEELYAYGHAGPDGLEPSEKRKFRRANAAYTMLTTSTDYTKFVQQGLLEGKGLKAETLQLMFTPNSTLNFKNIDPIKAKKYRPFGLGIIVKENEKGKQISHTGSNQGRYLSIFIAYPKTKESLVILTNSSNGGDNFREKVAALLLDK